MQNKYVDGADYLSPVRVDNELSITRMKRTEKKNKNIKYQIKYIKSKERNTHRGERRGICGRKVITLQEAERSIKYP